MVDFQQRSIMMSKEKGEGDQMKEFFKRPATRYWLSFTGKTIFYFAVLLILIYLYHYKSIQGGNFIYNEF